MTLTEQIIDLAQQIELGDPIDWGMLAIDEHTAYQMIAPSVIEQYLMADADSRDSIMLATVVKLTVENFVLNVKLLQSQQ